MPPGQMAFGKPGWETSLFFSSQISIPEVLWGHQGISQKDARKVAKVNSFPFLPMPLKKESWKRQPTPVFLPGRIQWTGEPRGLLP